MKLEIKREGKLRETEILITCSQDPDQKTQDIIGQLQFLMQAEDIIGYQNGEAHKLSLGELYYIESIEEKIFLYLRQQVYESRQKLYEWESRLEGTSFLRISKSTILNIDKLKSVRPMLGGKMEATMDNGEKQIINRHYMAEFRQKFGL